MKHIKFYAVLFLSLYTITLAFSNVAPVSSSVTSSAKVNDELATIISTGVLKIGMDTTYPPFESINATTNKAEGFDVDLGNYIAKAISPNVTAQFITSAWDPIIKNLNNGQFYLIMSAMTITVARAQVVNFTRWYYKSYQAILVPSGNPKNIQTTADLNKTGISVGVEAGTTEDFYATNQTTANVHRYPSIDGAYTAMSVGDVDCVLGDYAVVALNAKTTTNKVVDTYSPEDFGIAMSPGNPNLLNKLNGILNGLLGNDTNNPVFSSDYTSMYTKWFDIQPPSSTNSSSAPGFEYLSLFILAVVPIIRKRKNHN